MLIHQHFAALDWQLNRIVLLGACTRVWYVVNVELATEATAAAVALTKLFVHAHVLRIRNISWSSLNIVAKLCLAATCNNVSQLPSPYLPLSLSFSLCFIEFKSCFLAVCLCLPSTYYLKQIDFNLAAQWNWRQCTLHVLCPLLLALFSLNWAMFVTGQHLAGVSVSLSVSVVVSGKY